MDETFDEIRIDVTEDMEDDGDHMGETKLDKFFDIASQLHEYTINNNGNNITSRSIYVSFYTPDKMVNIDYMVYAPYKNISTLPFVIIINALYLLINIIFFISKFVITKFNEFAIYCTKLEEFPNASFSHVEISTEEHTYVVKWGSSFTKIKKQLGDKYGVLNIPVPLSDYILITKECEKATENKMAFNYIGNMCNFILPPCMDKLKIPKQYQYYYSDDNQCFCSEFIAKVLIQTQTFKEFFESFDVIPSRVSPNYLYFLLYKYCEKNPIIMHSVKNKKPNVNNNRIQMI